MATKTGYPNFLRELNRFFLQPKEYKTEWDFKGLSEYVEYVNSQRLRSLGGEIVMSHQELQIANYLYMNGVRYEYERPYEYRTSSILHWWG